MAAIGTMRASAEDPRGIEARVAQAAPSDAAV